MGGTASEKQTPDTQLFRDAFNASPIGIAVENLEGQPLFVNQAFCSMLGFSEEELRKKHCVDFSPPEDAAKDWELFQQLRAGSIDHYQIEKRYFRRDGSLVWGRLSLSLLNHRPSPLVIAMVEDITEQKKAEEARFRHSAIVESSEDAIASGTLDGIIVSWNPGAEKMYGYTEAEAIGKPITFLVPPELPDEEHKILERLKAGGSIEHFETVRVTKAGKRINVSLTISPIKDSSGRIVGISGIARDITERKRAEEALNASEERLRLAQQAARIGTFERDLRTGEIIWAAELESLYGLSPGNLNGKTLDFASFQDLIHPADWEGFQYLTQKSLKTGQPTDGEWRVIWPDGSVHWIAARWQVLMDESGEPSRVMGVNMDVTERKLAEEELARANERLHLAIESGSIGGWDYELKTGKNDWFGSAHAQLGMRPEETSGSNKEFWDRVHADDRERLGRALQAAKDRQKEFAEEFRVVWRDGTSHWLRSRGRYHYAANGEPERMVGLSVDITDRKLADEARFRLAAIVESSEDAIISKDVDGVVTSWNAGARHIFGYTEQETIGRPINLIPPELQEDESKVFERLKAGERIEPYDTIRFTKGGGRVNVSVSLSPIKDATGAVVGYSKIARDITERKLAEQALAEMTRKLVESQEQERTRIGRELHDDISQRLAMLVLELEQLQQNPSQVQSRLPELRKRTSEISSDVQALSHDLHSSKLEYLGVVGGIKGWCKEFGERHAVGTSFSNDVHSALPLEIGLPLFRVVQEALHNAVKHSGVKHIEVQLWEQADEVHLTITDKGRGFDVETAMHGPGLGLTSMRERVRLVNGTIAIDSEPNRGTTIHVRVPLESEASKRQAV